MLRSALAIAIGGLMISWTGHPRDVSFHETMVSVTMSDGHALHVSRLEVTVADWQRCVSDKGCSHMPRLASNQRRNPITGVNWFDVN